jgi:hypothetical protein
MLQSVVCRLEHFETDWYKKFAVKMRREDVTLPLEQRHLVRKTWEFCAIAQALEERNMLQPGRSGLGFAVGREPLSSLFASYGIDIVATDLATKDSNRGWISDNQHADGLDALYMDYLIDRAQFNKRVRFQFADMRKVAKLDVAPVDFLWSSCAFEHLGSLDAGLDFVVNAMRLVKPGGVAIHTTEYNVSSNDATIRRGGNVIYRRRDIEDLSYRLRRIHCGLERPDFDAGTHPYDLVPDVPPYDGTVRKHIKLELGGYVATSMLLIIRKA